MKKLEADLSRACIDYLKLCKAFTPRGIMERFENGYRKRANVASWLKKLGLKPDRSGIWTFAAKEDSMFKKCLMDCGLDVELVPSIAECLYAAFSAQIHDSYPEITQGVDGTATMNAGCLRENEKKVFSCLTKSFGIVVVYE
uniref:Uncharacterized protein n=1 Tax=Ditylenchus dipsaci TaxID=166011 RepID=A0A915D8Z8_9BILA